MLSEREEARYQRHLSLTSFGRKGQLALCESSVLCIGAGGLGSPAALYLAAAGIGRIGIVDDDKVDFSNLQRQILHGEAQLNSPKVDSALARLSDLNSDISIEVHKTRIEAGNVMESGIVSW